MHQKGKGIFSFFGRNKTGFFYLWNSTYFFFHKPTNFSAVLFSNRDFIQRPNLTWSDPHLTRAKMYLRQKSAQNLGHLIQISAGSTLCYSQGTVNISGNSSMSSTTTFWPWTQTNTAPAQRNRFRLKARETTYFQHLKTDVPGQWSPTLIIVCCKCALPSALERSREHPSASQGKPGKAQVVSWACNLWVQRLQASAMLCALGTLKRQKQVPKKQSWAEISSVVRKTVLQHTAS